MARLIYAAIASLDGYVADERGDFGWARPDAEVHAFVNDLERPIGTYLYGRRMYETMRYWETAPGDGPADDVTADYARIWRAADKIVYSRTIAEPDTARTRIEREFEPDAVRRLKDVGGPRPERRRRGARGGRPEGRARRRMPPAARARHRRGRHPGATGRTSRRPAAARRAALRRRLREPPLRGGELDGLRRRVARRLVLAGHRGLF